MFLCTVYCTFIPQHWCCQVCAVTDNETAKVKNQCKEIIFCHDPQSFALLYNICSNVLYQYPLLKPVLTITWGWLLSKEEEMNVTIIFILPLLAQFCRKGCHHGLFEINNYGGMLAGAQQHPFGAGQQNCFAFFICAQ